MEKTSMEMHIKFPGSYEASARVAFLGVKSWLNG